MKNLLIAFAIFSLSACTSSDSDSDNSSTTTPLTTAETIVGNWTSQSTDAEGSYSGRITIIESGEMSVYMEATLTTGAEMYSLEGMTWTLNGDQFTTTETFNEDVDTATITVINQNSFSFLSADGETLTLTRDADYESTIVGTWQYLTVSEGCQYTLEYNFLSSNEHTGSMVNDCNDDVTIINGSYTISGILSSWGLTESEQTYFAVQGNKLRIFIDEGDNDFVFTKQ